VFDSELVTDEKLELID